MQLMLNQTHPTTTMLIDCLAVSLWKFLAEFWHKVPMEPNWNKKKKLFNAGTSLYQLFLGPKRPIFLDFILTNSVFRFFWFFFCNFSFKEEFPIVPLCLEPLFDLGPGDLWPWSMWPLTSRSNLKTLNEFLARTFYQVNYLLVTDDQTDGRRCIRAHRAWAQVG